MKNSIVETPCLSRCCFSKISSGSLFLSRYPNPQENEENPNELSPDYWETQPRKENGEWACENEADESKNCIVSKKEEHKEEELISELDALKSMNGMDENDFEQLKAIYYMERPHAHHALYKNWHEMVEEAQDILWEYDIDPFVGLENLCWAPNIKGQHSTKHMKSVVGGLKARYNDGDSREDIVEFLNTMKNIAVSNWGNNKEND